jgi:hypothetical protein
VVDRHRRVEPQPGLGGVAVGTVRPVEVRGARRVECAQLAARLRHVAPAEAGEHVAAHAVEVVEAVVDRRPSEALAAETRVDLVDGHPYPRVERAPQRPAEQPLERGGGAQSSL